MNTYSLSHFTRFIRRILALNLPEAIWVEAEIGQANTSRGHTYLTLIEKDEAVGESLIARAEAVVWASQMREMTRRHGIGIHRIFRPGMAVRLRVSAEFHDRYGFKLLVEDADLNHTIGRLEQKRRATAERLEGGGFTTLNASIPMPLVPQRIAVVSSETAAGYADFRDQLLLNPGQYAYELELFPAAMQGEAAPTEIIKALKRISRRRTSFDVTVIIRGGGARMDLLAFDDEALCVSAAKHSLPLITGIGHETDEVLLDRVAQRSLKTPTAVATFLLDRGSWVEGRLLQYAEDIGREARGTLAEAVSRLHSLRQETFVLAEARRTLAAQQLRQRSEQLAPAVKDYIRRTEREVARREDLLSVLRPETVLARGYAIVSQKGRWITRSTDLNPDEKTTIRWQDGDQEV